MRERLTNALMVLGIVILSAVVLVGFVTFLKHIHTVTTIVVGATFLCYALYPAVSRLRERMPMWGAVLIVYAIVLAVLAITFAFVIPAINSNVRQLMHDAPALVRGVQTNITNPNNPVVSRVPGGVRDVVATFPAEASNYAKKYGSEITGGALGFAVSLLSVLTLFVLVPIVALYTLIDIERLRSGLVERIPPDARPKTLKILREINTVLGGFIRGQLLVAAIVGVLIAIMLTILHVHYAILIGAIAGLLEVIPYAGAVAGAVPAVLIALITNGPANAALVVLGFVIINQIEGHLLAPFVVGDSVGLRPLAVVLALFIGGELFGIPGLFIAVPVAGIIRVLFVNLVPAWPSSISDTRR
jgi:predicted PurR-regulated permease PerM